MDTFNPYPIFKDVSSELSTMKSSQKHAKIKSRLKKTPYVQGEVVSRKRKMYGDEVVSRHIRRPRYLFKDNVMTSVHEYYNHSIDNEDKTLELRTGISPVQIRIAAEFLFDSVVDEIADLAKKNSSATNERVRDLINKKLKLMADVFASGYKGMPGTAIGKRRNPAKSRALRALANIIRPKGCRPRGYIAAVANTTPTDLHGLYLNEPEEMAKRWQKRYNEEHGDPTPLGLALVNRVTGETIDSIGSLNHVIASSSDFSKIATAPHLAVKNASATGVQSLIRNPVPATQSLGFVSGNDIADSFIRRVNRNNAINDYDEITYYRNIDDRYRNSIEDDLNYLYGAYGYKDD